MGSAVSPFTYQETTAVVGVSQSQSNVKEHDDIRDDDCWQVGLAHSNQLVLNGTLRTEGDVHHWVRVVEHELVKPVVGGKQKFVSYKAPIKK